MEIFLPILIFVTIVVVIFAFGVATVAPSSVLGTRLREIGWQRPKAQQKPPMRDRIQQALDHLSRALPISPHDVSRTRALLIQLDTATSARLHLPRVARSFRCHRILLRFSGFRISVSAAHARSLRLRFFLFPVSC